jgi:hypothetical protein
VNAKVIADEDVRQLESWIFAENERNADICAIVSACSAAQSFPPGLWLMWWCARGLQGFQEMVDLNAVNVASDHKSAQRAQAWQEKLTIALNNNKAHERYVMVRPPPEAHTDWID